jgi:hypothetical protein
MVISVVDRVALGAELLTERFTDEWPGQFIRPRFFDLESGTNCVLGQIYGDFQRGLDALELSQQEAREHGFLWSDSGVCVRADRVAEIEELTAAWRDVFNLPA